MMDIARMPIVEFLPMKPPMVFLDRILSYEGSKLVTEVNIRPGIPYCEGDGVPAWIGIEYMAQTVAAHAGVQARLRGDAPSIGFLLGTRAYQSSVNRFLLGENLEIHVEPLFREEGLAAFSCSIEIAEPVATATVNVYQPEKESLADFWADKVSI